MAPLSSGLLSKVNIETELLTDTNAPKAVELSTVIVSVDNGPHAVRTQLGWTINPPLCEDSSSTPTNRQIHAAPRETLHLTEIPSIFFLFLFMTHWES